MRVRTLEIRWHDQKPISTCDFQPFSHARKSRLSREQLVNTCYRLATGGEDHNVRVWLVRPNILPSVVSNASSSPPDQPVPTHPPRVEYRSTLSKHSAAVNVVRFSPNGELIASAGDDGMIIIWSQTDRPPPVVYGSDNHPDEDPEHWKVRISFRCTTNEIYDLAWSPTGEYVIAGSTDNAARIFSVADGTCVRELVEHNHYVQGVAWDPINEYIATQSSDRAVHVHSISKNGGFETHAVGKNVRMHVRNTRTPSANTTRPRMTRRPSIASDNESAVSELPLADDPIQHRAPHTPSTSMASTPTMFPPPKVERPSSRRSSFSGSNAAGSPAPSSHGHFGRSPSPMPPLPAIRPQSNASSSWSSVKLYGDESFTNFFRRLTFSPDGSLLLTPAGQFEDPSVVPGSSRTSSRTGRDEKSSRGRKQSNSVDVDPTSTSSVYIYTRANFARPPVAQLPGHKKPSVAVKFSPVLYELRKDITEHLPPKRVTVERGQDCNMEVDIGAPLPADASEAEKKVTSPIAMQAPLLPSPSPALGGESALTATPSSASAAPPTSVFALPYRMLFSVATMDTITIHDTQQAGPVCMFTKLHYDEFTDMAWSPDGQCLMLSSRDGFCTIIVLDEHLPAHHTQQHTLQMQALAQHVGPHPSQPPTPALSPSTSVYHLSGSQSSSHTKKRSEPDDGHMAGSSTSAVASESEGQSEPREPVKKKRRIALTHVADLGSS